MSTLLEDAAPEWFEEPLRADSPTAEWQPLARSTRTPPAAGENLIGDVAFDGCSVTLSPKWRHKQMSPARVGRKKAREQSGL